MSSRAAAIKWPGTIESQVESRTIASNMLLSTVSSTSSAMRLRLGSSTYFGSRSTMPSQIPVVIISNGSPPASRIPCLTRSLSVRRWTWPGLYSFQLLMTATIGRSNSCSV